MQQSDAESKGTPHTAGQWEQEYFQFCREQMRPYFGRIMWASQGLPLRHVVMQELVRIEAGRKGADAFHILEVGSWAGGSAISWAEALTRYYQGNGRVVCVDPWKPYFDMAKRPDAPVYREMSAALANDTIYDLFLHNIKASGHEKIVMPLRGQSTAILPTLPRGYFDLAFIDGDHSYSAVLADLRAACVLVKDGGILCGDDLELQLGEIDVEYAKTVIESDFIRDPRSGGNYHPGVTLAVGELLGEVASQVGFWAVRKQGARWIKVDLSQVVCADDRIPAHLVSRGPSMDPVFVEWKRKQVHANRMAEASSTAPESELRNSRSMAAPQLPSKKSKTALLIQLEFPNWKQARAWAYPACFGVAEGLRAQGVSCTTIPLMANAPFSIQSWLAHAQQVVAGQHFDQVWVWLVHASLDATVLDWITGLAPVRVGVVMESLAYEEEDYAWAGHLRMRQGLVENQLRAFTHALLPDERDVQNLAGRLAIQALWWPTMVPARCIASPNGPAVYRRGVFHGQPYGPRQQWVSHEQLQQCLTFAKPAMPPTHLQALFDQLQSAAIRRFSDPALMTGQQVAEYAGTLKEIREGEFREWMAQLSQWAAIVNLPSLAKFFGGRVFEGIAAGRPVLSYAVPQHPLNNALFTEGEDILFFSPDRPESLRDLLDRVIRDEAFAATIARNAQRKLRAYHTSEHRLAQTLAWIESGQQPDYGVGGSCGRTTGRNGSTVSGRSFAQPEGGADTRTAVPRSSPLTTVFVLTIDDPVFRSCVEALSKQEGPPFTQDTIRNVSPFSAAAQEMMIRCTTPYFIQVDEDMILNPDAVAAMTAAMEAAPDDVGMICFHLHDDDRDLKIQGVKIYRTALMKDLSFQDRKASEMDLLDQMGRRGIKWVLHPDVVGRHGTQYSVESIYLRYKSMYEKDIRAWNTVTWDVRRKAECFLKTGDPLQLFALLGAAHGIINAPHAQDREKDARTYGLKELEVFKLLLIGNPPVSTPYDANGQSQPLRNPPAPMEHVRWKQRGPASVETPRLHRVDAPDTSNRAPEATPESSHPKRLRVLLATPIFWPSIGGVETIAENLGVELLKQGYVVDVATIAMTERTQSTYRGMNLLSLTCPTVADPTPRYTAELFALVMSGRYQACVMICSAIHPFIYSLMNAQIPASTRVLIQPIINKQSCEAFAVYPNAKLKLADLLRSASAALVLTRQGLDAQLMRETGITPTYLPNATTPIAPTGDFRAEHRIPRDAFVVLHVANLWEVKNHLGLLQALPSLPAGMRLVMIGHATTDEAYGQSVRQALAKRPDVLYIPGLSPENVAAAMQAADVVVLASHAEASPVTILEAMSHRKPWLATPDCGAVVEHAGGIVTPLHNFLPILSQLRCRPDLRQALADIGYEHWRSSYSWDETIKGWMDVIETGCLQRSFDMPGDLARRMEMLREQIGNGGRASETEAAASHRSENPIMSEHVHNGASPMLSPNASYELSAQSRSQMQTNAFYTNLFVKSAYWSTPHPNPDEAARWSKIAAFLEYLLRGVRRTDPDRQLRMLDVGCGRGWLTSLATMYGSCEGIEPVAEVIEHARRLFPHLRFEAGTAQSVLRRPDFVPYDVILCSEVIEHVPHGQKEAFVSELAMLLKPGGFLILTTPRGEMWDEWKTIAPPNQPVEDWVTEEQLRGIFTTQGFCELGLERVHVEVPSLRYIPAPTPADLKTFKLIPIYQIWACQRVEGSPVPAFTRPPMVSVIVPTYNRPDRLREAISSILAQTYQDFEIVVVNDGTADVTEIIASLNKDGRMTCIKHDRNRGLAAARNTGIRAAKGKYVAYLDDDDRYLPHHLETLVTFLEGNGCKAAYTDAWRVHEKFEQGCYQEVARDLPYSYDFNPANLLVSNYFPVLCVMHERHCLDAVGIFDEALFAHEDWDLWIRMATQYPFVHIKQTTAEFTWRGDGTSMTSQDQDVYLRTTEIIYRKYAPYVAQHAAIREAQHNHLRGLQERQAKRAFTCSIVIPVWNKGDLTRQCLQALATATREVPFEVIIVDNGSTDDTPQLLAALGGDVRVITNATNLGFAKACNQGAAVATGEYLVFLNNDTIPLDGWLIALVDEVKAHPEVAIVGSKLLYQDRTVQHAGVAIDRSRLTPYHIYKRFAETHPAVNKRRELNAVTGACMLVRRKVFTDVGGFDEGYLNGFEDMDFCLKVREKQGKIVYQPKSVLFHWEGQTAGRDSHTNDNGQRFLQRWGTSWWLGDADRIYLEDGYKAVAIERDGKLVTDLHAIDGEQERSAWQRVADTQRAAQQRDEAAVALQLSKCADWPADKSVLKWAASVADAIQQPALAAAFMRRVAALDDPAAEQIAVIREALSKGEVTTASSRLEALLKHYPSHAEGLLLKAILHMQREQYRDAEIAFTTALNQGADRRKCLMGIGMASMGRAYPQGAWQTFLRVLAENPDDAEVIHWLLRAGTAQNRWPELCVQLRNYVARNPSDISARFAYASVLLRAEQIDAARQEYNQLEVLAPEHEGIRELGQAIAGSEAVLAVDVSNV